MDYREGKELSWCPACSNSLWQGWSCGLVYCPGGNATDLIWRVLASSLVISSWTPLKSQHSNPNPNPINSDELTSLLLPHLSSSLTDSLPSLNLLCHSKTDARFMQDAPKAVWSLPYVSVPFFPSLKHNFIAYRSSKVSSRPDCIFEIHQLWQSGFSRVYSISCCSCSFEREIIKIGQSSHKMYSNNIVNFRESTTILNACTKKRLETYWMHHVSPLKIFILWSFSLFQVHLLFLPNHRMHTSMHTSIYTLRMLPQTRTLFQYFREPKKPHNIFRIEFLICFT